MDINQHTISLDQIDTLSVTDARTLCEALTATCNAAGTDDLADIVFPLMSLVEQSLLSRPVNDVETLAAKVRIACSPVYEGEPQLMVLWRDVEEILGLSR